MICYVDMEHRRAFQSAKERAAHHAYVLDVTRRLEETSSDRCEVRYYDSVTTDWLDTVDARALVISGNVTDWAAYDEANLRELYQIVRSASLPILGLCGGLQLIAMAHGTPVGPIQELKEQEIDPNQDHGPGYLKEWGFKTVQVTQPDPLFAGIERPTFLEAHCLEVKAVPDGFRRLASTELCRIQVLKKIGEMVYGTQFHPEAYIAAPSDCRYWLVELVYPTGYAGGMQPAGRQLLMNFFRLAGVLDQPEVRTG